MSAQPFKSFVVFAEMRTGSNFLETNLNAIEEVHCHGEAFNPHFIGYPANAPVLGVDQKARDRNPRGLLDAIRSGAGGIHGFRYFHNHDPRVFDEIMEDRSCAKIILTRNPVESYVSWKIAQQTGQWKLTSFLARKSGQAYFDEKEFEHHLAALQAFQQTLLTRLQTSGQTAFYVSFDDLQSLEVMNGIARYLGVTGRLERLDQSLKRQNPSALADKVRNPEEMVKALARLDRFDLSRTPNFEPRRGPNVPSYIAAPKSPLLYLPLRATPRDQVISWLASLDGVAAEDLLSKMTQKDLRQWKRKHPGHRSFTVLRHPVARGHYAFCRFILPVGSGAYLKLRGTLARSHGLELPDQGPSEDYSLNQHRVVFKQFLRFLKSNLDGQTSVRVDAAWCTQVEAVAGFSTLCLPDRLVREADMTEELPALAKQLGLEPAAVPAAKPDVPFPLDQVYDAEIEQLTRAAYQRDYLMFGFANWA